MLFILFMSSVALNEESLTLHAHLDGLNDLEQRGGVNGAAASEQRRRIISRLTQHSRTSAGSRGRVQSLAHDYTCALTDVVLRVR